MTATIVPDQDRTAHGSAGPIPAEPNPGAPPLSNLAFRWLVGTAAAFGFAVRLLAAATIPIRELGGDSYAYIVSGARFTREGFSGLNGRFPPLNQLYQALIDWVFVGEDAQFMGLESSRVHSLAGSLWAVPAVIGLALLGRRLGGNRLGVLAGVMVAASPVLIDYSARVVGETIVVAVMPWMLLVAFSLLDRPHVSKALGLGVLLAALALLRAEMIAVVPGLAAVMLWTWRSALGQRRIIMVSLAVALPVGATALWSSYSSNNLIGDDATQIAGASSLETTMLAGNCREIMATGPQMGWKSYRCTGIGSPGDPLVRRFNSTDDKRQLLVDELKASGPVRVTVVSSLKVLRSAGLFQPATTVDYQATLSRWPSLPYYWAETVWIWAVITMAGGGALVLRRLRVNMLVLAVPLTVVAATIFATFGFPRYRLSIDPILYLGAAAFLTSAWGTYRGRRSPPDPRTE